VCLCNLLNGQIFTVFFNIDVIQMRAYVNTYNVLLERHLKHVYDHMTLHNIDSRIYFVDWILTLYTKSFPMDVACQILDVYLLEGEFFLFRVALGVLSYIQGKLLVCGFRNDTTSKKCRKSGKKEKVIQRSILCTINRFWIPRRIDWTIKITNAGWYIHYPTMVKSVSNFVYKH